MVAREAGKSGVLQLAQSKGPAIMLAVFLARVLPLLFALVCSYLGLIEGWVSSLFWGSFPIAPVGVLLDHPSIVAH